MLETVENSLPKKERKAAPVIPTLSYDSAVNMPYIQKIMPVSQAVLEIGIKDYKPSENVKERLERDVAMTILDEMLFSRAGELYNELFESGLINESYSYGYSITKDAAFHSIYAESDNPDVVFEKVKAYIQNVKRNGLNERDFIRCKRVMMAEFIRDFDSVDDIANSLLNFVFEGSDSFEYREIIEKVSFDDVLACLDDSFDDKCFALSVIKNNFA